MVTAGRWRHYANRRGQAEAKRVTGSVPSMRQAKRTEQTNRRGVYKLLLTRACGAAQANAEASVKMRGCYLHGNI